MRIHIGICALLWSVLLLGCSSSVAPQATEAKSEASAVSDNSTDVARSTASASEAATINEPSSDQGGPVLIGPGVSAPDSAPALPDSDASEEVANAVG